MSDSVPRITVVIPVKDDAERLRSCLSALDRQTFELPFEIIVVDNGSTDDPASVVSQFRRARMLVEQQPSSYAARNLGAANASGDVLAFLDSDCIPDDDWLENGYQALTTSPAQVFVAGSVRVFARDPAKPTAVEQYDLLHGFPMERYLRTRRFGGAGNMFVHKETFFSVGPFDGSVASGGDREWGQRAHRNGVVGIYAESVGVAHPARATWGEIRTKVSRIQKADVERRRRSGASSIDVFGLMRSLTPPIPQIARDLPRVSPPTARARLSYVAFLLAHRYLIVYERLWAAATMRKDSTG
jgi:glycosyltransferase involved in cell wall biosynthesis